MARSLPQLDRSDRVRTLDSLRPTPAKVTPSADQVGRPSDRLGPTFAGVVTEAVLRYYGSVKAAAISLRVDPSLMMREFHAGKFGRLEDAEDAAKGSIARALSETFGEAVEDPKVRARRKLPELMAEFIELVS